MQIKTPGPHNHKNIVRLSISFTHIARVVFGGITRTTMWICERTNYALDREGKSGTNMAAVQLLMCMYAPRTTPILVVLGSASHAQVRA